MFCSYARRHTVLAILTIAALAGCAGLTEPPPELVGRWDATTFRAGGDDEIAQGMAFTLTFTDGNEYFLNVANDRIAYCETGTSCSDEGEFEATGSLITFDPGTEFEASATYSITGSEMSMNGNFEGLSFTATMTRTGA